MVKKWKKDLDNISKILQKINFTTILEDILTRNYWEYDKKLLSWYKYLYRIRIWSYRIIFEDIPWKEVKMISIKKRWDVYKWL